MVKTLTRLGRVLAVAAIGVSVSACASGGQGSTDSFNVERPTSVRLIVQNRNFSDVRLYTIRRGTRTALGTVTGKQDREFTFSWNMPDPMQVEIDMVAGPKCFTREMQVDPGDTLELQIAPVFTTSSCRA